MISQILSSSGAGRGVSTDTFEGEDVGGPQKTLTQIFTEPTKGDVTFDAALALLKAHGGVVKEGAGSRVKIFIEGKVIQFHRPHKKELPKYVVEAIREVLEDLGIKP